MKPSLKCPKCQGVRIWIIERFRVPADDANGSELPVAMHRNRDAGLFSIVTAERRGAFDLYACATCGYSELWATGLEGLREDPANGVRLIDAGVPRVGPFR